MSISKEAATTNLEDFRSLIKPIYMAMSNNMLLFLAAWPSVKQVKWIGVTRDLSSKCVVAASSYITVICSIVEGSAPDTHTFHMLTHDARQTECGLTEPCTLQWSAINASATHWHWITDFCAIYKLVQKWSKFQVCNSFPLGESGLPVCCFPSR